MTMRLLNLGGARDHRPVRAQSSCGARQRRLCLPAASRASARQAHPPTRPMQRFQAMRTFLRKQRLDILE